ncbi:sulfotransferase family protein [Hyphomonas sp.]|jgi:hypothetical protein|uniref:sulfotransferase family protein n=1 Tax=Hyphomonas sp. TaxID=87 RepID=UPI0037BF1924
MDPVFILSSPRSFTSVVAGMVGMHPSLYSVPELHLLERDHLQDLVSFFIAEKQEKKLHGLRRIISQLVLGEQTLAGVRMADRWLEKRMHLTTADLYRQLILMTGGLGFVDKSPAYSLSPKTLERLARTFPESRFIHLVRHPIAQGLSMAKLLPAAVTSRRRLAEVRSKYRNESTVVPPLARDLLLVKTSGSENESNYVLDIDFQHLWLRMQLRILSFLKNLQPGRHITLKGEDFLRDPISQMQPISTFLGIPWCSDYEDFILHPEWSPYACIGPQGAQFGNDVNYLLNPVFVKREFTVPDFSGMPIPWRTDGAQFSEEVVRLANYFGYT